MTERRADPELVAAMLAAPETRFLPMKNADPLLIGDDTLRLGMFSAVEVGFRADDMTVFLGLRDGVAHVGIDVGGDPQRLATFERLGEFSDLRRAASRMPLTELAIACQAKALHEWHARNGFCANCGAPTVSGDGGNTRDCPQCGTEHFPRTDPAVITLVVKGDSCLLARNAKWIKYPRFSALAGFVEAGETIEEAVAREVFEEVGVRVRDLRYFASQPWPFPGSLMMGFRAESLDETVRLDPAEIAEARWFTRDEAERILAGRLPGVSPPISTAIAFAMIDAWVGGTL